MNGIGHTARNALASLGADRPSNGSRTGADDAGASPFAESLARARPAERRTPASPADDRRTPAATGTEPDAEMPVSTTPPAASTPPAADRAPESSTARPAQPNAATRADARAALAALAEAARAGGRGALSLPDSATKPAAGLPLREVATAHDPMSPAPAEGAPVSPLAQILALMAATPDAGATKAGAAEASPDLLLSPRASAAALSPAQVATGTAPAQDVASLLAAMPAIPRGTPATDASTTAVFAVAVAEAAPRDAEDAGGEARPDIDGTSAVGALSTAARTQSTSAPAALTTPLAMPAQPDDGFDDGFGARIAWMADQKLGHAQIRLNPEHVGPIDVRVQLDGTKVMAEFNSAHADVRQALEASLPRLREMLGQHGLQLGQAEVGQRHAGDRASQGHAPSASTHGQAGDAAHDEDAAPVRAAILRSRGLLDEYA